MKSKTKAIFYTLTCVFLWALIPVVAKLGQNDLDNHQFLFWSSLISFIVLLTSTVLNKKSWNFLTYKKKDWLSASLLGLLGTYISYILIYYGYSIAVGLEVLVIQYSWPMFVVLISIFVLKEKLNTKRGISVVLGFTGVFVVLSKGDITNIHFDNLKVDLLVVIAAISFALFSVLSKKVKFETYTVNTIYFLAATIASLISMLFLSEFSLPTKSSILPILINGIFVNGLSYILWIKALRTAEASFIAPFVFLTPIVSAVYLVLFFGELFLPVYAIGIGAVILGGLINK